MDQNKRAKKEEEENLIVFEEAQLPVTISDLRKPTNEFITKLIEIFCNTFQIDGNTIKQVRSLINIYVHVFIFVFEIIFKFY